MIPEMIRFFLDNFPESSTVCTERSRGVLIAASSRSSSYSNPDSISDQLEELWVKKQLLGKVVSVGVLFLLPDWKNNIYDILNLNNSISAVHSNISSESIGLKFGDYDVSDTFWFANVDGYVSVDPIHSRIRTASTTLLDEFLFTACRKSTL